MSRNILEAGKVIRSKNSGPFELTLDIIFKNRRVFELFRRRQSITPELVARLYRVRRAEILKIVYFEPALALKVTLRR